MEQDQKEGGEGSHSRLHCSCCTCNLSPGILKLPSLWRRCWPERAPPQEAQEPPRYAVQRRLGRTYGSVDRKKLGITRGKTVLGVNPKSQEEKAQLAVPPKFPHSHHVTQQLQVTPQTNDVTKYSSAHSCSMRDSRKLATVAKLATREWHDVCLLDGIVLGCRKGEISRYATLWVSL